MGRSKSIDVNGFVNYNTCTYFFSF